VARLRLTRGSVLSDLRAGFRYATPTIAPTGVSVGGGNQTPGQVPGVLNIESANILDASITSAKIANLAVGTAQIADLSVTTAKIAALAVTSAKIGDLEVTTAKINDLAVTNAKIGALAVTNANINDLDASKINAGLLSVQRLNVTGIFMQGFTWTDNSPAAGRVAWSAGTLQYDGVTYSISSGNTATSSLKYIYWQKGTSNTTFQASASFPTLGNDDFLIATNVGGVHDMAASNSSATDSIPGTALSAIIADDITTGTLTAITINGGQQFSDTLGSFYPVVISSAGDITLNSSQNHKSSFVFHNTQSSTPSDIQIYYEAAANVPNNTLRIIPSVTNGVFGGVFIARDIGAAATGKQLSVGNLNSTGGNGTGVGIAFYHTDAGVLSSRADITVQESSDAGTSEEMHFELYNGSLALHSMSIHRRGGLVDIDMARGTAPGTSDTRGFIWIPKMAGAASGTPSNDMNSNGLAMVYDSSNNRLRVYNGGWVSVALA